MINLLKRLCERGGTSGREEAVRDFVLSEISDFCKAEVDKNGNIICFKKGKKSSSKRIMLDAHMDEVGIIATSITDDGFVKFATVGGIDTASLLSKSVVFENGARGVIGLKPVHLSSAEERKKLPKTDSLYIDIGAENREEAEKLIALGDTAVFDSEFSVLGDRTVKAKALDDRAGVSVLIGLLKQESEYDFYATFSVQEEVGLRGAGTATFTVDPEIAIVLEATTAADLEGVSPENTVCSLGEGPAVSFMDKATLYDRDLYEKALKSGIKCQPKAAVAGGNNAGAIHLTKSGVPTLSISLPCRYIHSASSVADLSDLENMSLLARRMIELLAE